MAGRNVVKRQRSSLYLLCSLTLGLATYPYLAGTVGGRVVTALLGAAIPISAIYSVSGNRRTLLIGLVLGVPAIGTSLASNIPDLEHAQLLPSGFLGIAPLLFYAFTAGALLRHIVRAENVTANTLYEAIASYLLLGLMWTCGYLLVERAYPGSFAYSDAARGQPAWTAMVYYSFVTLTTLGFGDITPVTPQAQSLTFLESTTGVLYIAVLISRLVSAYRPRSAR